MVGVIVGARVVAWLMQALGWVLVVGAMLYALVVSSLVAGPVGAFLGRGAAGLAGFVAFVLVLVAALIVPLWMFFGWAVLRLLCGLYLDQKSSRTS